VTGPVTQKGDGALLIPVPSLERRSTSQGRDRVDLYALTMSTAENSNETVRVIGKPFKPGQSGNPGGRPKGVARTVREVCGGDPTMLAEGLLAIARGGDVHGKPARAADQIRASELLLAYGWGKPAGFAAIEGHDPLEQDTLAAEAERIAAELRASA
jgi:Family of unknown function (DUF5681)